MTAKELANRFARIEKARTAILDDLKLRFQNGDKKVSPTTPDRKARWGKQSNYFWGSGEIPCPVCSTGKLRYSRSGHNGHVAATCSTRDCVNWME